MSEYAGLADTDEFSNRADSDRLAKLLLEFDTTPAWPNGCTHEGYLFTFTNTEHGREERLDVYLFDSGGRRDRQELCLRYGPENSEYYSPGGIRNVLQSRHCLQDQNLVSLLMIEGYFRWESRRGLDDQDRFTPIRIEIMSTRTQPERWADVLCAMFWPLTAIVWGMLRIWRWIVT